MSDVFDMFSQISSCGAFGVHRMKLSEIKSVAVLPKACRGVFKRDR